MYQADWHQSSQKYLQAKKYYLQNSNFKPRILSPAQSNNCGSKIQRLSDLKGFLKLYPVHSFLKLFRYVPTKQKKKLTKNQRQETEETIN